MPALQAGTSNRTALRIVPETVFNTTPATPAFENLRYTGESLQYAIKNVISNEIRADRMTTDLIQVGADVSGDINVELSFDSFKDLIASALCSTWGAPVGSTSTIKNGTVLSSYTIQKHFQDLAVPVFQNFSGCRVGSMKLDFKTGSILTGSFGFMGCAAAQGTAQIAGATFTNPGQGNDVFNAVSNLVEIQEDGVPIAAHIKSMSLELNNNLRAQEAIGILGNAGVALGKLDITGNIELYFEDQTEYNKFLNHTAFSLSFKLLDSAGNYYLFTLPKVKYEEGNVSAGQIDQDLMIAGKWRALYDTTSSSMIQIDAHTGP